MAEKKQALFKGKKMFISRYVGEMNDQAGYIYADLVMMYRSKKQLKLDSEYNLIIEDVLVWPKIEFPNRIEIVAKGEII